MWFSCCIKFETRMSTEKRNFLSLDEEKNSSRRKSRNKKKNRDFLTQGKNNDR